MIQYKNISTDLAAAIEEMEQRSFGYKSSTPFHLGTLNDIFQLFTSSCLTVLAADVGIGIDQFVLSLAMNRAIDHGIPTALILLNDTRGHTMQKILASRCGVELSRFMSHDDYLQMEESLRRTSSDIATSPLHILDGDGITLDDVCDKITEMVLHHGVKVVVADGLQWLWVGDSLVYNSRRLVIHAAYRLKALAMRLGISIVLSTNLTDVLSSTWGVDSKIPQVRHLPGANALMSVADIVAFLYRMEYYHIYMDPDGKSLRGIAELQVEKLYTTASLHKRIGYNKQCLFFYDLPEEDCDTPSS